MKTIVTLLLGGIVFAAKAGDQIQIVRHGTNVTEQPGVALATNIVEFLRSGTYASTSYAVKAETWRDFERSDSFVLLTFANPRKLKVPIGEVKTNGLSIPLFEETPVDQILVPLPERTLPAHVFARSGTNVFSVTKMSPSVLGRVASEPALHLSRLYTSLADIDRP